MIEHVLIEIKVWINWTNRNSYILYTFICLIVMNCDNYVRNHLLANIFLKLVILYNDKNNEFYILLLYKEKMIFSVLLRYAPHVHRNNDRNRQDLQTIFETMKFIRP